MDIRKFFGGASGEKKRLTAPEVPTKSSSKQARVVTSDSEEEELKPAPAQAKPSEINFKASEETPSMVKNEVKESEEVTTIVSKPEESIVPVSNVETPQEQKSTAKQQGSTPYIELAQLFERISEVKSRLAIQEEVKVYFQRLYDDCPDDLLRAVYLCINAVAPAFDGSELGVGDSILIRAISEVTGRSKDALQTQYKELGDLGSVALAAKAKQSTLFGTKPKSLTVQEVFTQLRNIAKVSGNKSMEQKVGIIKKLLISSSAVESKFIVRGLQGKLRIGLAEATVLVGLAHAIYHKQKKSNVNGDLTQDDAVQIIKQIYSECPSYDVIVPAMLSHPLAKLPEVCHIKVGIPVKPMLAKPTKGVGEVLNRFEDTAFTCEFKYDGERAQIHRLANGEIRVFSRNLEDNTSKYPDLIEALSEALPPSNCSFIVDSEVVAYDRVKKQIMPFQILSTRARKDVATKEDVKVQVVVFLFDMLYLNGQSLLKMSLQERREKLMQSFNPVEHRVQFAVGRDLSSTEDILEFFNESVKGNCEGLMIKTLEKDATYEPSKRSLNWLKLKKDYMDNLSDSVDLVPIGAYYGRGKRVGVFGGFLMACYDAESEEFQSVCKVATGFSEEALEEHTNFFKDKIVKEKQRNYITDLDCDVWFDACVVWEIKAADLQLSPVHKGALGLIKNDKGVGLRFPRFLRKRDDKKVEDATSSHQIEQMYREQAVISQNGGGADDEDDDW